MPYPAICFVKSVWYFCSSTLWYWFETHINSLIMMRWLLQLGITLKLVVVYTRVHTGKTSPWLLQLGITLKLVVVYSKSSHVNEFFLNWYNRQHPFLNTPLRTRPLNRHKAFAQLLVVFSTSTIPRRSVTSQSQNSNLVLIERMSRDQRRRLLETSIGTNCVWTWRVRHMQLNSEQR